MIENENNNDDDGVFCSNGNAWWVDGRMGILFVP